MKAILEINSDNSDIIKKSIDVDEKNSDRIKASTEVKNNKIIVTVEAEDFSALRAGVTSYLRLIKTCLDVE